MHLQNKWTALHESCYLGDIELAILLVKAGAQLELLTEVRCNLSHEYALTEDAHEYAHCA